jgi:hypothetical protein
LIFVLLHLETFGLNATIHVTLTVKHGYTQGANRVLTFPQSTLKALVSGGTMLKAIGRAKLTRDTKHMLMAAASISAMPLALWLMQDRPLHATTAQALAEKVQARQEAKKDFWRKLPSEVVIYDHDDSSTAWMNMADSQGTTTEEAAQVLHAARMAIGKASWPVYMERGWIRSELVWIVGSARGHQFTGMGVLCGTESQAGSRLSHWIRFAVAVESKAPYRVLWRTPEPVTSVENADLSE